MIAHRTALCFEHEIENYTLAVAQKQQVLHLQITYTVFSSILAILHLISSKNMICVSFLALYVHKVKKYMLPKKLTLHG